MPLVVEEVVLGWASCTDALCPGYRQERAEVRQVTKEYSYLELGGDIPGTERSMVDVVGFEDPALEPCPHCAKPRIAANQERPEYPRSSGQDPLYLLNMTQTQQIHDMKLSELEQSKEISELKALIAQQQTQISGLLERPRGPGRPRKDSE